MDFNDSQLAALEKDLAADLAAINRVRKLMRAKGNPSTIKNGASHLLEATDETRNALGEVHQAVIEAIRTFRGDFTASEIDAAVHSATGKSYERSSIRSALSRLVDAENPIFTIKSQGRGRRPTVYKRLTPL